MKFPLQISLIAVLMLLVSCGENPKNSTNETEKDEPPVEEKITMTLDQANRLVTLPLECVQKEYPNKLGHTLGSKEDLGEPQALHPAFYGCFDWHSSVHGNWSMVRLLKEFPNLAKAERIRTTLRENISQENIAQEVVYFQGEHNKNYERTYGWGWLLKLSQELITWDDPLARELETNLRPLTRLISDKFINYLPKLQYPVRVGTHTNTAFALAFAWDYAQTINDTALQEAIKQRALDFYHNDAGCPLTWEPSGADFLSPCFEELDLMRRILGNEEFLKWMEHFMPQLRNPDFDMAVALVGDREDGQLVHLDGLNFSRAWVLYGLASQYPEEYGHLLHLAHEHLAYSFPNLVGDNYEGGHWLGSFAIYALGEQ